MKPEIHNLFQNIDLMQQLENIVINDELQQPFEKHIREFFDFVKKKLFKGDNLDQLTEEGQEIEKAIKAMNNIVESIVEKKEITFDDDDNSTGLNNPIFKIINKKSQQDL